MSQQFIYLIRHGESEQNVAIRGSDYRFYKPDHAVQLTDLGKKQADRAGEFLRRYIGKNTRGEPIRVCVYNSPYARTRTTRDGILQHIPPASIKEDDMLVELQFGLFDGLPKHAIPKIHPEEYANYQRDRQYQGKFFARRPGGESPLDCEIRQKLFLETLFRDFPHIQSDHILIIGHGAQLTVLRKAIFHYSYEWYEAQPNPGNCSIQLITRTDGVMEDTGYIYGKAE